MRNSINSTILRRSCILFLVLFFLSSCVGFDRTDGDKKNGDEKNGDRPPGTVISDNEILNQFEQPPPLSAKYRDSSRSPEERAQDLLTYMNLDEKLGQMIQVDRQFLTRDYHITTYALGSLLSGGGSVPNDNSPEGWATMIDEYQNHALNTRLGIPLLYGTDAVHGHNNMIGATIFPHNIGLGAGGNSETVQKIGIATAIESRAVGINWNFSPSVAIPQDIRWGRTYEGFSEDPELTARLGTDLVVGMQGTGGWMNPAEGLGLPHTLLSTLKHFIGDGGTYGGIDQGDVPFSLEVVKKLFLLPYEKGIAAGVGSVMATFNSILDQKVHGNEEILSDLLRGELGFQGILVSDWAAIRQLPGSPMMQNVQAVNAGIDMIMVPDDYHSTKLQLKAAVLDNYISMERIDQSVSRILTAKFALGLFEDPFAQRHLIPNIGSDEHRQLGRKAVQESLVILKNEGDILPITSNSFDTKIILLTGPKANDLGSQSGGWTLTWQGFRGNLIPGTTIWDALQERVNQDLSSNRGSNGGQTLGNDSSLEIFYRPNGILLEDDPQPDLIITVIGENPYAEMEGDSQNLTIPASDIEIFNTSASIGVPMVTILFSGRPVILDNIISQSDALVAAWLPGSEGQGVLDVLFGDVPATGTLPYTWPESVEYIPIQSVENKPGVLFPRGYGLTYQ